MIDDGSGDDLAQGGANANRCADGPEREIEASCALREVRYYEYRHDSEYSRTHAIQNLDRNQCHRVMRHRIEHSEQAAPQIQ